TERYRPAGRLAPRPSAAGAPPPPPPPPRHRRPPRPPRPRRPRRRRRIFPRPLRPRDSRRRGPPRSRECFARRSTFTSHAGGGYLAGRAHLPRGGGGHRIREAAPGHSRRRRSDRPPGAPVGGVRVAAIRAARAG